jgi:histidinol dehydrogenase
VAAQSVGISEIYRVAGPQAIAALAYGTKTIAPVEMIAGIGDFYTNLAKKLVSDHVKIDYLSITSDLVIIADSQANPRQLALDLLAQAEQYSLAAAILLTTDKALAPIVQEEVQKQLQIHPQRLLTEKAIAHYGLIVVVESLEKAIELSNLFAPTHLSLMIDEPWEKISSVRQSGTILLGSTTPKAVADYLGCPVGVETFLNSATLIEYPADSFASIAHNLQILAQAEGFTATDAGIESRGEDKN